MRSGATWILCAILLAALCPHATAQIVRWTDERGEVQALPGQGVIGQDFLRHSSGSMDTQSGILTLSAR